MRLRAALALALASVLLAAAGAEAADRTRPDNRVINGTMVAPGDYNWTVALVDATNLDRAFCGGTLVQDQLVVTAAHCVIGTRKADIRVVAGENNLTAAAPANIVQVTRLSLHPLAEVDDDTVVARRDAALLTLQANPPNADPVNEVGPTPEIASAQGVPDGVHATGWGLTESSTDTVPEMRVATLELQDDADCAAAFDFFIGDGAFSAVDQMCAIADPSPGVPPDDDVRDTCNGDSGGPLAAPIAPPPDPGNASDWVLLGVTSYGLGCASVDSNGDAIPGVYSRVADDAQLRPYANQNTDTSPEQPEHVSGTPQIDRQGNVVFCVGNPLTWSGGVDQVDQLVRRFTPPFTFETVSRTGVYGLDDGDFGDRFICEVHGRASGAGGYGLARSGFVQIEDAEPPPVVTQTVTVPGPIQTVPGPAQTVEVDPRAADKTAPGTRSIRRSCTRRRVCTFTIATSDAAPSAGVTNVNALLTSVTRRGRRTTTRTTFLRGSAVSGKQGTFRIRTRRLATGSHSLLVTAVDGAGNVQRTPRRSSFRLR